MWYYEKLGLLKILYIYIAIRLYYLIICMSQECAIKYKTPKTTEKAFWKVNERVNKKTK